jgi:DNA-binding NtrC family response regulator
VTKVDVRILAATNSDLRKLVEENRFREDLYYRLNVIHLEIPALRDRREDVPALVKHFFQSMRVDLGREDLEGFTPEAMTALETHAWPGNIRELQNVIERAVLLCTGSMIDKRDLPASVLSQETSASPALRADLPQAGVDLRAVIEAYESTLIRQALARTNGNKNRAAQLLGLNRTTLVEMVKRKKIAA